MAPTRSKKRASDQSTASTRKQPANTQQKVPLRIDSPSTPQHRSPIKKRKGAITLQQKQALIDNLQLEITERARRLRAQYNLQAQGLRSRIEIRINRIPVSLRKAKMGDLLLKYANQEEKSRNRVADAVKEIQARSSPKKQTQPVAHPTRLAGRAQKRMSDAISGDKENDFENIENAKKRIRAAQPADASHVRPAQVLSPTSSNSRLANRSRPASPIKSQIARPTSPLKNIGASRSATATSMLSSMVEKAKATRAGVTRKVTATSSTSSSSNGTTAATRARRAAPPTRAPPSRPATRTARRVSANSETSEASTGTVVKRTAASRTATSTARKGTAATARKAAAGAATKRAAATKSAASASTTATGRVLRKRG